MKKEIVCPNCGSKAVRESHVVKMQRDICIMLTVVFSLTLIGIIIAIPCLFASIFFHVLYKKSKYNEYWCATCKYRYKVDKVEA